MKDQRDMSKEEFEAFVKAYDTMFKTLQVYPCNEVEELTLRSICAEMWTAGKNYVPLDVTK